MRIPILLLLTLALSCAHEPERYIASEPAILMGEVSASHSRIKFFESTAENPKFHLELRDSKRSRVDVELSNIQVHDKKGQLDSLVRRLGKGRYTVELSHQLLEPKELKFIIQDKVLNHKMVLKKRPSKAHSQMVLMGKEDHRIRLRLTLRDKNGSIVDGQEPDIILEGLGQILDIQQVKTGVWEFSIAYPEGNQLLYFSVRANGVLLERMFRFQHIEK